MNVSKRPGRIEPGEPLSFGAVKVRAAQRSLEFGDLPGRQVLVVEPSIPAVLVERSIGVPNPHLGEYFIARVGRNAGNLLEALRDPADERGAEFSGLPSFGVKNPSEDRFPLVLKIS
jgi:hypothetical protein